MCGIVGFLNYNSSTSRHSPDDIVLAMTDAVSHRGPDDHGHWVDESPTIAIGHRRLAVVDLSAAGHQPMISSCGRWVIAYNGEIYSHIEMRKELCSSGSTFRGASDTEVILEGISKWGIEKTISRMIGMFAIALWDRQQKRLHLIRDRLGIKPLYWSFRNGLFVFSSELKAMHKHPQWSAELDRNSVAAYLRHNYVPAPYSIYRSTHKLEAGKILTLRSGSEPEIRSFWDLARIAESALATRTSRSMESATDDLNDLILDAVKRRMLADVPLGAFLSGGIDSSMVAAAMQSQSNQPIRTFSIGFSEESFNEAPYARKVAEHLGTDHTELLVDANQTLDVVPKIPDIYCEPFSDSSQIPTFILSRLTKQHVTVALSGDGGDELFAGYNRYGIGARLWKQIGALPAPLRRLASGGISMLSESALDSMVKLLPPSFRPSQFGHKAHKLSGVLRIPDSDTMYRQLISHWASPDEIVIGATEPKTSVLWQEKYQHIIPDIIERMQFFDTLTYLPDDILTKVDRASMAVALEVRVPLLDHRIVEFAWQVPLNLKIQGTTTKVLLRNVLERYVPAKLFERPKMGFGVPIDLWLRTSLRDWAENLLAEPRLREQGILDPGPIRAKWKAHLDGENWAYPLWDILMLQAWLDRYPS